MRYAAVLLCLCMSVARAQEPRFIHAPGLDSLLRADGDTLYLLHFWATWCQPCLEEMPSIEQAGRKYKDRNLKIILVSLDAKRQVRQKLVPYLREQRIASETVVLDEPDPNCWMGKVDQKWTGTIPATLFLYPPGEVREFYEKKLSSEELDNMVRNTLKIE